MFIRQMSITFCFELFFSYEERLQLLFNPSGRLLVTCVRGNLVLVHEPDLLEND